MSQDRTKTPTSIHTTTYDTAEGLRRALAEMAPGYVRQPVLWLVPPSAATPKAVAQMAQSEYDELDPLLIAAIEDHFDTVDPLMLLGDALKGADPEAGVLAYEAFMGESVEGEL